MSFSLRCLILLSLLAAYTASAQSTYESLLEAGVAAYDSLDFDMAIINFEAAEVLAQDAQNTLQIKEVGIWLDQARNGYVNKARQALREAKRAKAKADSIQQIAERVLSQMYFYQDRLALTVKQVRDGYEDSYRYGFINPKGEVQIDYQFEFATPFSPEDGFARVRKDGTEFLLDKYGNLYNVATSLDALNRETEVLDLHGQNLKSLPDRFGNFPKLRAILLYNNQLREIPPSMGKIRRLEALYLNGNGLVDLPPSVRGLTSLRILNLANNRFSQFPRAVCTLSQLNALVIADNALERLPDSLPNLKALVGFDLSNNAFRAVPKVICQLDTLQSLLLDHNQLRGLPREIGQLRQLRTLHLHNNLLTTLPDEISQLSLLTQLVLEDNQLTGLPASFAKLKRLEELYVGKNQLTTWPEEFSGLRRLRLLDLQTNNIDAFPKHLCSVEDLRTDAEAELSVIKHCPEMWASRRSERTVSLKRRQLFDQRDHATAFQLARTLTERFPDRPQHWYSLSWIGCFVGEYQQAAQAARETLRLDSRQTGVHTNLALAYLLNGQYESASAIYNRWKDQTFPNRPEPAQYYFLRDIKELEMAGITHPDFEKARRLLEGE